jgi:hypothetical protein
MPTNQQPSPDEKPQRNAKDAYLCATRLLMVADIKGNVGATRR